MTNNAWKCASWKMTKIVVVRIIYVKILFVHTSCSSHGSWCSPHITVLPVWERFLSHLLHPPACYGLNYSFAIMRVRTEGTTSWLGKNLLCACGKLHRKRKRYMTAGVPAPISTMEIQTQMVNDLPTYYGLCCASVNVSIRVVDQTNPMFLCGMQMNLVYSR